MGDEGRIECPVCGTKQPEDNKQPGTLWLGQHKRNAHKIVGETAGRRAKRRRDGAPRSSTRRAPSLAKDIRATFAILGTMVAALDPYCGTVIIERSEGLAKALADLAKHDARVERWLRSMGKVGPYGALFVAAGEVAVPIAAHHGLIPREMAVLAGADIPPERPDVVDPWEGHSPEAPAAPNGEVVVGAREPSERTA